MQQVSFYSETLKYVCGVTKCMAKLAVHRCKKRGSKRKGIFVRGEHHQKARMGAMYDKGFGKLTFKKEGEDETEQRSERHAGEQSTSKAVHGGRNGWSAPGS